jgi:hypothetical protein
VVMVAGSVGMWLRCCKLSRKSGCPVLAYPSQVSALSRILLLDPAVVLVLAVEQVNPSQTLAHVSLYWEIAIVAFEWVLLGWGMIEVSVFQVL